MKLTRATIALYMSLVFASGAALGVFGNRYYEAEQASTAKGKGGRHQSPEEFRKLYLSGMQKQLNLSNDQVSKLSAIIDETRTLLDEVHKRHVPERDEITRSQDQKIRALFDPFQLEKYDALIQKMAEKGKAAKAKGSRPGGF